MDHKAARASCLLFQFFLLVFALARADDRPDCVVSDTDVLLGIALDPSDPRVIGRLVFVAFPNLPEQEQQLPAWADDMADDLGDFIHEMSQGRQELIVSVIRRPAPDQNLAWLADSTSLWYSQAPPGLECEDGSHIGELNKQIMEDITDTYGPNVWQSPDTVEAVFIVHYRCAFGCSTQSEELCERSCCNTGTSTLALQPGDVPEFLGRQGTTQRLPYCCIS